MINDTRPSPSIFAYCKRSKTGRWKGLGTRLEICNRRQYLSVPLLLGTHLAFDSFLWGKGKNEATHVHQCVRLTHRSLGTLPFSQVCHPLEETGGSVVHLLRDLHQQHMNHNLMCAPNVNCVHSQLTLFATFNVPLAF